MHTNLPHAGEADSSVMGARIQNLRSELGEGEGVTALLCRAAHSSGVVMVREDEGMLSDDEAGGTGVWTGERAACG